MQTSLLHHGLKQGPKSGQNMAAIKDLASSSLYLLANEDWDQIHVCGCHQPLCDLLVSCVYGVPA